MSAGRFCRGTRKDCSCRRRLRFFRLVVSPPGSTPTRIVDKLVALESLPITKNSSRQAALNVQISSVGDLMSKIKSLASNSTTLASGVGATSVATVPSGISAVTGTGAAAGRYAISVTAVANAAKARSGQFASANSTVAGGNLTMHIQGVATTIAISANSDLGSVARQINAAGKPIRAAVISDGTFTYLSLTNRDTGKPIGSAATGGLTIDSDATGLGMAVTQNAANAVITVDDLTIESKTNDISNAIPGVTITAKALQTVPSDLIINADSTKGTANVQSFVDGFNAIVGVLQKSLRPDPNSPPVDGTTLDGATVFSLQQRLNSLLSAQVVNPAAYRTLADIGVKLKNDGTLTIDSARLNTALANDPAGVDAIFSTATTGIAARMSAVSSSFTDSIDGQLVQRQKSLTKTVKDLQSSSDRLQKYVDTYKIQLQRQFSTMENLISKYNSIGTFLNNSASAADRSSK